MNHPVLEAILILLVVAVVVVSLFRRFKLPPILAYLFTGAMVGPFGLGLIPDMEATHILAEFGVVFLLFMVGLEFSIPQLIAMRKEVLVLGGAQTILTTGVVAFIAWNLGMDPAAAFIIGGVLALSSTAIVIRQLSDQLELNSRHGRFSIGILLFQDLAVIPFLVIIPALSGTHDVSITQELATALIKGVIVVIIMLSVGHWLLRPLFREIASSRSPELFTLTVLMVTLASAWATSFSGLSLALGAFLAGIMLGETEFRHQVAVDIRPFRDVLLGLFFITIGMLLNLHTLPDIIHWVLLLVVAIVVFKTISIMILTQLMGGSRGVALRTGIVLAQGGEFGFALLSLALSAGLLESSQTQVILAAVILSMALTPVLIRYNGKFTKHLFSNSYIHNREQIINDVAKQARSVSDHVIICGYGRIGQNVVRFLEQENIPYIALDLDPKRVAEARAAGEYVNYGDATHREILDAAGLYRARALIISFDDALSSLKLLPQVKEMRKELPILVRTRDDANLDKLLKAGATEVVPESLETSLMMATQLLILLNIPVTRIVRQVQSMRNDRYKLLRAFFHGQDEDLMEDSDAFLARLHTVTLTPKSKAISRKISALGLDEFEITITAVNRGNDCEKNPAPDMILKEGDALVLYGTPDNIQAAEAILL